LAVSWNQINLSWSDVNNETAFKIERSIDNVNFSPIGTTAAGVVTFSDTTVVGSTQYYYRVCATNNVGDSGYSNLANATTPAQPTVPAAPGTLTASAVSFNQVNLSWGDVATETGYKIERSTDNVSFTQIGTTTADVTSYSDTTVAGSTQYFYRVRATNAVGDSTYTNIANATTPAQAQVPAAPTDLVATVSSGQIALTWTDNSGNETGFRVERSIDGVNFAQIALTTLNTYTDPSVAAGTKYYYRVQAYNNAGPSTYSNVANATVPTAVTAPAAPSNLVATAGSSAQIALAWTDNASNEDGFRVERSTDGVNFAQIGTATLSSFMDQTVAAGTKYYYRVLAYNSAGPSGYSNVANATVASNPTLPAAWSQADVGSASGSATYSNGVYTVKGSGSDISGNKDAFHYVYQQITGDATIIVRVLSVQNTDNNAKAGIMFRNTLDANSKEAGLFMTANNGLKFLTRTKTGGSTSSDNVSGKSAPYWLKLVRVGDTFKAYRSSDGVTWTKIGEQTISMNSTIYVGLAVCSKKNGTLNTSTFDNVSIVD
jgi:fibronectin type 3 domain-containing protein/regulation of enolase protein 1 (concanavalin A-like superfamily)